MEAPTRHDERRHLAILFADLSSSTRIASAMEPEDYSALLEQLRDLQKAIIARHGGIIVRIDGDGGLFAFGYPATLDDAGRRATEAAIELHAAVAGFDRTRWPSAPALQLHSGIHAGVVLVRTGDIVRGSLEILGDATNVAARLCDAAAAGEIIVSTECLASDRHFFVCSEERGIAIGGRSEPIMALPVHARSLIDRRIAARQLRGITPFCGRQRELAALWESFDACRGGALAHIVIEGPAGIGKTRLLSEFLAQAEQSGVAVHRGYCEAYLGARPLQAFEQIIDAIAGSGTTAVGDIGARLRDWIEARDRPTIIAIDDWQWADDASHQLLADISRSATGGLLIILARRPEAVPIPGTNDTVIDVGPLSDADAELAIRQLLPAGGPFTPERIRKLAGGSPLYIEELCQARSKATGNPENAGSSAWLDGMVQARFDALPPDLAELVRLAAVIGHIIPSGLFVALTGIGPAHELFEGLSASDFLFRGEIGGTVRFKHALTRDAIYKIIGPNERRLLHRRVAERLEALAVQEGEAEYVEALAYHHAICGNVERAIDCAVKAGDQAMAVAALDRAQAQYRLALDQAARQPIAPTRLTGLVSRFGRASVVDPGVEQIATLSAAAELAERSGNAEAVMLADYFLGYVNYGLGNAAGSIHHLEKVRAAPGVAERPGFLAQLLGNLGQSYAIASDFNMARRFLDDSIQRKQAARKADAGAATGLAYSLSTRAYLTGVQGHFNRANADFAAAMAALNGEFHPVISSIKGLWALSCLLEHDFDGCFRHVEDAIAVSTQARARFLLAASRSVRNFANWSLKHDGNLVDALVADTEWLTFENSRQRISNNYGWLTMIMGAYGRADEAQRYYAAACARADAGDRLGEGNACRAMARLAATTGSVAAAQPYLDRAWASAELREAPREAFETDLVAAELWHQQGHADRAGPLFDRAIAGFRGLGMDRRLAAITPLA